MSAKRSSRKAAGLREQVELVEVAVRKMGAQSVVTSKTVANRFGLHTTDLEVLDLIYLRERASAGELAEATGLTSGSVTALIDRLVEAGYVARRPDPADRRKVMVAIRHDAIAPIKAVFRKIQRRMFELWSTYDARELAVIADFMSRSTALQVECIKDIRRERSPMVSAKRARRARMARGRASGGRRRVIGAS